MKNQSNLNKLEDKLRKLIAKKNSAEELGSIHEAEALASKIQELAFKYGIEISNLKPEEQQKYNKPNVRVIRFEKTHWKKNEGQFVLTFYHMLAKTNMCLGVGAYDGLGIDVIGFEHNIDLVEYLADQLIPKLRVLARKDFNSVKDELENKNRNTYLRGWYQGATVAIKERLMANIVDMKKADPKAGALIKTTELALKDILKEKYPNSFFKSNRKLMGNDGKAQGYKTGKSMGIHQGVGGPSVSGSKLLS